MKKSTSFSAKGFIAVLFFTLLWISPLIAQREVVKKYYPEKKYTQPFVDSIINTYKSLPNLKVYKNILDSDNSLLGWPFYYYRKAGESYRNSKFDSVFVYAQRGIDYINKSKSLRLLDNKFIVKLHMIKGNALSLKRDYKNSIMEFQKAIEFEKKYPYKWKSYIIAGIASNHIELGNDSIALSYYHETIKDTVYMNLQRPAAATYNFMGFLYKKRNDYELAKKYYFKGLEVSQNGTYKSNIVYTNYNIADIYLLEKNKESALFHFKEGLKAFKEYGNGDYDNGSILNKKAEAFILIEQGNIEGGIYLLKQIIDELNNRTDNNKLDKDIYDFCFETITNSYISLSDYRNATEFQNKYIQFLKDYFQEGLKSEIEKLEISFQTKEKDLSIVNLKNINESQNIMIKQRTIIAISSIAFFIILSILIYIFYRKNQLKNKYVLASIEQRLLRSQLNPHFLFNALNTIVGLSYNDPKKVVPFTSGLSNLLIAILENSKEEFITLEEEVKAIEEYLILESFFSEKFKYKIKVDDNINSEEIIIPPMFIQPFVENAIKHGLKVDDKGLIELQIKKGEVNETIQCIITDNGIGYSKSLQNKNRTLKSYSGEILKERLKIYSKTLKAKAYFTINDRNKNEGTIVNIYMPFLIDS